MKLKNQSGRSMVEMLGVLAIIGVLSVGGIAGYKMAMRKNAVNKLHALVQNFYVALEEGIQNPNSEMNVVCKYFNGGDNCKKQKYNQICQLFMGAENCESYKGNFWGVYRIPNSSVLSVSNASVLDGVRDVCWGSTTFLSGAVSFQLANFSKEGCVDFLNSFSSKSFDRFLGFSAYCNTDAPLNPSKCKIYEDFSKENIDSVCALNSYGLAVVNLWFDGSELDLIDARDED